MTIRNPVCSAAVVGALALLGACSSAPSRHDRVADGSYASAPMQGDSGRVSAIEVVPVSSRPSGAGAIIGAVIGGVVGNQFGSGGGKALATGAGIIGGAVAGNAVESRNKRDDEIYRVSIRLDSGGQRTMDFHRIDDLRVGDRVRFDNGQLYRY